MSALRGSPWILGTVGALWLSLLAVPAGAGAPGAEGVALDAHLLVDQFGYRPRDLKVAVLRNPEIGYDAADKFTPGHTYELRRSGDGGVVFTGIPKPWHGGTLEPSSGDSGWWFDFSTVTTPGSYFVYDVDRERRSPVFRIDDEVYRDALKAAVRMYFYQRSGFAKKRPFADTCWVDDAAYLGPDQDGEAHDVTDRHNAAKVRDLRGGWFDAGDTNKYVTFAMQPVHQLLTAYQEHPTAFTDDFNLPESGNGIPDLLDEVKWETDWLERMQSADGSAALKVGEIIYAKASQPSKDKTPRYYVPSCTSSTIAVAGMFAHAALVFGQFPALAPTAADLKERAIRAWNNYQAHPQKEIHCDTGVVHAGNADLSAQDQDGASVVAAIYLLALTGDPAYDLYVRQHYRQTQPYRDFGWSRYKPEQGEALLFYTSLSAADRATRTAILADKRSDAHAHNQVYGFASEDDLYRDFLHEPQYHWGSNNPRASYGTTNLDAVRYGIDPDKDDSYRERALGVLHYFHGVNPFGKVYLSNMYGYGVTNSVNELFHFWYWMNTIWDDAKTSRCGPAPGYVPGGPVANASAAGIPVLIQPPSRQPPQKSYRDWNGDDPERAYIVNEPAIYYQSPYVKLLSAFVD